MYLKFRITILLLADSDQERTNICCLFKKECWRHHLASSPTNGGRFNCIGLHDLNSVVSVDSFQIKFYCKHTDRCLKVISAHDVSNVRVGVREINVVCPQTNNSPFCTDRITKIPWTVTCPNVTRNKRQSYKGCRWWRYPLTSQTVNFQRVTTEAGEESAEIWPPLRYGITWLRSRPFLQYEEKHVAVVGTWRMVHSKYGGGIK